MILGNRSISAGSGGGNMTRCFGILFYIFLAFVLFSAARVPIRGTGEGNDWLKWNEETRLIYVSAYVIGFDHGFTQGCKTAEETNSVVRSTGLPGDKCIAREPKHPQKLENYVQQITKYYESYPADRFVPIRTLIDSLSDTKNLTLQQIHQYNGAPANNQ
jgi:hypothetical protein